MVIFYVPPKCKQGAFNNWWCWRREITTLLLLSIINGVSIKNTSAPQVSNLFWSWRTHIQTFPLNQSTRTMCSLSLSFMQIRIITAQIAKLFAMQVWKQAFLQRFPCEGWRLKGGILNIILQKEHQLASLRFYFSLFFFTWVCRTG